MCLKKSGKINILKHRRYFFETVKKRGFSCFFKKISEKKTHLRDLRFFEKNPSGNDAFYLPTKLIFKK